MEEKQKDQPRWRYRFKNFERAFLLLRQAMELKAETNLNELELEGVVQRFEFTFELAWKTLKDYLEKEGMTFPEVTPKTVFRSAFQAGLIFDGESWFQMIDDRNRSSHIYSQSFFVEISNKIAQVYFGLFAQLYDFFLEKFNQVEDAWDTKEPNPKN